MLLHLCSASCLQLVFKGPTNHCFWALKCPLYWNTMCWKVWVPVLESLLISSPVAHPCDTQKWSLFKPRLHFPFLVAWGGGGAQWGGQEGRPARPPRAGNVDSCPHSSLPHFCREAALLGSGWDCLGKGAHTLLLPRVLRKWQERDLLGVNETQRSLVASLSEPLKHSPCRWDASQAHNLKYEVHHLTVDNEALWEQGVIS